MKPTDIVAPADTIEERGSLGAPPVKEEYPFGETLLILFPDRTQPPMDTSHVPREGDSTAAEEPFPGNSSLNPQPPLWMPQPVQGAIKMEEPEEEERVTEGAVSPEGDITAADFARRRESSLYPKPPLFMNTPQPWEGAIKKEEPVEDDVMGEGGMNIFDNADSPRGIEDESSKIVEAHGARRDTPAKVDEAKDAEASEDDEEARTTHGNNFNKWECQLCHSIIKGNASRHIACSHLKNHLYTCPVCDGYGSGNVDHVARHITQMHPSDLGKRPISHVKEQSTEMQRLQATCFPNLKLKVSRSTTYDHRRVICIICNEKVIKSHRQDHVFRKHFKKGGLFECPLCAASPPTFDAVRNQIKSYHKKDYGKVHPVSHEEEYKEEISALNEKCFPGWKRYSSYGKTRSKGKGTEAGEESEGEMEEGEGGNKELA